MSRHFASTLGNSSDLLVTIVNTADRDSIRHFRITGTPFICLVLGPKRKYWPVIRETDEEIWDSFIREHRSPSLHAISDRESLQNAIGNSLNGGTSFHLQTPSSDLQIFSDFREISRTHRIFGCSFTFEIQRTIRNPILTAFLSPNCSRVFSGTNVSLFVSQNKFSALHKYDLEEYQNIIDASEAFVFLVVKQLEDYHKEALLQIHEMIGCNKMITGWASTSESKRKLLTIHSLNFSDLPVLIYWNPHTKCAVFFKGQATMLLKSEFVSKVRSFQSCNQTFYQTRNDVSERDNSINNSSSNIPINGISGISFICISAIVSFGIIQMLHKYERMKIQQKDLND
jgi:hypothetical protein